MRRGIQWAIGLLISAVAFWLAFQGVRLDELAATLSAANYLWLAPALGLIGLGLWARAHSWRALLGQAIPFPRFLSALSLGYLLNNVLPFRLGEVGRAYALTRGQPLSATAALSSVLVERLIDLCVLVGLFVGFLPLVAGLAWARNALWVAGAITVAGLGTLFVLARSRERLMLLVRWVLDRMTWLWFSAEHIEALVVKFLDGIAALQQPRRFLAATGFSFLAWLTAGLSAWCILNMFPLAASLPMAFFMLVVSGLAIALPAAPGNLGVWQYAVVLALGVFDVPPGPALGVALIHHLSNYLLTSLLGGLALAREGETLSHLAQSARTLLRANEGARG